MSMITPQEVIGRIPPLYETAVILTAADGDPAGFLTAEAVLRHQQAAAEAHLAIGGLTPAAMMELGWIFVAARWRERVFRAAAVGETLTLRTWHRERRGASFRRCFEWRDAAGAVVRCGVTEWALVSVQEHRLLSGRELDPYCLPALPERPVDCGLPRRYPEPPTRPVGEYTVIPTDIDRNGHMNNARYAGIAAAFLPALGDSPLTPLDWQIRFCREALSGQTLTIETGILPEAVFLRGRAGEETVFTVCAQNGGGGWS